MNAIDDANEKIKQQESRTLNGLSWLPDEDTTHYHVFVNRASIYGFRTWRDFYTSRQLLSIGFLIEKLQTSNSMLVANDDLQLVIKTLLALSIGRCADYWSSLATWAGDFVAHTFGRQALPFVWDFAEVYPFSDSTGNWTGAINWICRVIERESAAKSMCGQVVQSNAATHPLPDDSADVMITDPPYYFSIQYADLSDYFYVWLRRALLGDYPDLFHEPETPKREEAIVQSPGDQYKKDVKNREHYKKVMVSSFIRGREIVRANGIGVIVFANATAEGWETLIESLIQSGWIISGSWPIDTERPGRVISMGRSVLASSIHLVCRPRESADGSLVKDEIGNWRDVLAELPTRIHEWMPRLAEEGVVGADAIFACLGPALEIYSRYSSVEKASGEKVELKEYLEEVWAAVSREAMNMIFEGADASGFEEDARLTAMWLWTLKTTANGDEEEIDKSGPTKSLPGYSLEYDAARKIAQGLGAHLENLSHLVETKGDTATLLSAAARTRYLFGKNATEAPKGKRKKKDPQMLLDFSGELNRIEEESGNVTGELTGKQGSTVLDQLHQSMILFAAGRGEAVKRFLVEEGVGRNPLFWRLAQALSALYPMGTDEKRWVDGVMARKKGLGL